MQVDIFKIAQSTTLTMAFNPHFTLEQELNLHFKKASKNRLNEYSEQN